MTTFPCPSDILITSWLFTAQWSCKQSRCPTDMETSLGNMFQLCKIRSFYIIDCTNWMNLLNTKDMSASCICWLWMSLSWWVCCCLLVTIEVTWSYESLSISCRSELWAVSCIYVDCFTVAGLMAIQKKKTIFSMLMFVNIAAWRMYELL